MENRLDAVGPTTEANPIYREGAGVAAITGLNHDIDSAWVRRSPGGCIIGSGDGVNCGTVELLTTTSGPSSVQPQDTNDNAADFIFVDTNGNSAVLDSDLAPRDHKILAVRE